MISVSELIVLIKHIHAEHPLVGKTLAFTSIKFMNKNNELVARGSHTKFVAIAHKDPKNIIEKLRLETGSK